MSQARLFDPPVGLSGMAKGKLKIDEIIAAGSSRAKKVIDYVQALQPVDRVREAKKLNFITEENEPHIYMKIPGGKSCFEKLHKNALRQASAKTDIPWSYVDKLMSCSDWGLGLLAENFDELFEHLEGRLLLRSVNGEVRGILSDRYRRLDSRPLVDSFCRACAEVGARPYEGYVTDTKVALQAVIPKVYEPFPGEYMAYGVCFENSDFGNGALNISIFVLRLLSDTSTIGADYMRKVHLGKRLEEEAEWTERTKQLDMQTMMSAIGDMVHVNLADSRIEAMQGLLKSAFEMQLTDERKKTVIELLKRFLTKGEVEKVLQRFNEPEVELLPPGNNVWRMSSAVSWLAGATEDTERKLEIQKVAGKLLPTVA